MRTIKTTNQWVRRQRRGYERIRRRLERLHPAAPLLLGVVWGGLGLCTSNVLSFMPILLDYPALMEACWGPREGWHTSCHIMCRHVKMDTVGRAAAPSPRRSQCATSLR